MIQRPNRTARPYRVLVIDDDASVKSVFAEALDSDRFELRGAPEATEGLRQIESWQPDIIVLDRELPGRTGLELLPEIIQRDRHLPVLVLTAMPSAGTAIEAIKLGAFDYAIKPVSPDRLAEQVDRAVENRRLLRTPVIMQRGESHSEADFLVGRCSAMQRLYKTIGRLAAHDLPCLIQGEPGTGKKLVARTIHAHGSRADRPLGVLRCGDYDRDGIAGELFGSDRSGKTGLLAACRGGTLVVEEITALPMDVQSSLLTQIRQGAVDTHSNCDSSNRDDITLIFTTTEAADRLVGSQRVRSDLFYELSGNLVTLPPLRHRKGDIGLLVDHYVQRLLSVRSVHPGAAMRVSEPAMQLLTSYPWPGNVTELKSVVRRALIESCGTVLDDEYLRGVIGPPQSAAGSATTAATTTGNGAPINASSDSVSCDSVSSDSVSCDNRRSTPPAAPPRSIDPTSQLSDTAFWQPVVAAHRAAGDGVLYGQAVERLERGLVSATLEATGGNLAHAARILGMTRVSLRKKIQKLQLPIPGRGSDA